MSDVDYAILAMDSYVRDRVTDVDPGSPAGATVEVTRTDRTIHGVICLRRHLRVYWVK